MKYLIGLLATLGALLVLEIGWLWLRYGVNGLSEMIDAVWDVIDERKFQREPPPVSMEEQRRQALADLIAVQQATHQYSAIPFEASVADLRTMRQELLDKWPPLTERVAWITYD